MRCTSTLTKNNMAALNNERLAKFETTATWNCKRVTANCSLRFSMKKNRSLLFPWPRLPRFHGYIAGNRRAQGTLGRAQIGSFPSLVRFCDNLKAFHVPLGTMCGVIRRSQSASSRHYPCPHSCVEILTINDHVDQSVTIEVKKYNRFFQHHVN